MGGTLAVGTQPYAGRGTSTGVRVLRLPCSHLTEPATRPLRLQEADGAICDGCHRDRSGVARPANPYDRYWQPRRRTAPVERGPAGVGRCREPDGRSPGRSRRPLASVAAMATPVDRQGRPVAEGFTASATADEGGQVTGIVSIVDGDRVCIQEEGSDESVWVSTARLEMLDWPS